MSPSRVSPGFTVTPIKKDPSSKANFGVTITDIDLNNISDDDVQALSDTIWKHKVVVVKGQKNLTPKKQWELVRRFDPEAENVHSHGEMKVFSKVGGVLARTNQVFGIPGAENVRVIGKGYQGEDHFGIKDFTITHPLSHDFHAKKLSDEDFNAGHTRFQRWHIDAPLYGRDPAWFTTLRCFKRPAKNDSTPPLTVHWDDDSGYSMKTEAGMTAFMSNVQAYELMTDEERRIVDHSWVEYAPHPYMWISNCKGNANGLGLESQGLEKSIEELGEYEPEKVKKYPLVWVNPVTGERAFMVHGLVARRLFLRSSVDEEPRVVDDVKEIRAFLKPLQERVLTPEYVVIPTVDEGDVAIWANYQMFHTAIDYPDSYGPRTMHQSNIPGSKGPVGPVPIPANAS